MRAAYSMVAALALSAVLGCAPHVRGNVAHGNQANYLIDKDCLTGPIHLKSCNDQEPPACSKIAVDYRKGCERMDVSK